VPPSNVTFMLIARIPPEGTSTFATYEDHVLPLLAEHGGVPGKGQFRSRFSQSAQLRLSDNDFSGSPQPTSTLSQRNTS
jgi:hypothetical protein